MIHIKKRKEQYWQILLKSKNDMISNHDEKVIFKSVKRFDHCNGISLSNTSMFWMIAYTREICNSQFAWLVTDGNWLYKLIQYPEQEMKLYVSKLCYVILQPETIHHWSVTNRYQLQDLMIFWMQLILHFMQQPCVHDICGNKLYHFQYPVPRNVALVIVRFQHNNILKTDLDAISST